MFDTRNLHRALFRDSGLGNATLGRDLLEGTHPLHNSVYNSEFDVPSCGGFFEKYKDILFLLFLALFLYLVYTALQSYGRRQRRNNTVSAPVLPEEDEGVQ
jgi:hypothetical protein